LKFYAVPDGSYLSFDDLNTFRDLENEPGIADTLVYPDSAEIHCRFGAEGIIDDR
jgi:hypothetical protein